MTTLPRNRLGPPSVERRVAIVPSMLDVDFARLGEEVIALEQAGADRLQWDVMDGLFVPRLTHGPDLVRSVRGLTELPFEAHLMVQHPEAVWPQFADAGADLLIVHAETTQHLHLVLGAIRAAGRAAGVALNPATPIEAVRHVVDLVDLVLIMTVNPGWGGQSFIATMLDKVGQARLLLDRAGSPADIEVDGGVSAEVAGELVRRGANVLVAGSAVHRHPAGRTAAIRSLRDAALDSTTDNQ
jgi:ribulose-phosphate 3-epimerase